MRIGLTLEQLAATTWSGQPAMRYAARIPGLNVLAGETVALVGTGTDQVLEQLAEALESCAWVDGSVAAAGGVLRVHAQQAARVGLRALAVSGPFDGQALDEGGRALAVADLAGLAGLGLTTVVEVADVDVATQFADRVVVVDDGRPAISYPVVASTPRTAADVQPVTDRVQARLLAAG